MKKKLKSLHPNVQVLNVFPPAKFPLFVTEGHFTQSLLGKGVSSGGGLVGTYFSAA
jgi:hypothetical protein